MSGEGIIETRGRFRWWLEIPTRWMDNDVYGHVNNVQYYSYFDTAVNTHLIREAGLDIHNSPIVGLVVETRCQFKKSLVCPDRIDAGIRVERLGRSSVTYATALFREGDDEGGQTEGEPDEGEPADRSSTQRIHDRRDDQHPATHQEHDEDDRHALERVGQGRCRDDERGAGARDGGQPRRHGPTPAQELPVRRVLPPVHLGEKQQHHTQRGQSRNGEETQPRQRLDPRIQPAGESFRQR